MVEQDAARLDAVFHALSDRTRRAMLRALATGERSVSDLAAPHAMTLAGASKHVAVLERAGLVRRELKGRSRVCRLTPAPLGEANSWLDYYERFWNARLDALDALFAAEHSKGGPR